MRPYIASSHRDVRPAPEGDSMPAETIFRIHMVFGYIAWLLCFATYIWPRLKAAEPVEAHRAIATLHSFRFFGLVFLLPGVTGPHLPHEFALFDAYGDFATGILAILALLTVRIRPAFWTFVVAFNVVGFGDIMIDYYHAIDAGVPFIAGEFGSTYAIPVLYVPLLIITHVTALYLLLRPRARTVAAVAASA
jgi:hypothetical protein